VKETYQVNKKGREISGSTTGGSTSVSKSYDHSAVDEARKSRADAGAATAATAASVFSGDIGKAIAAGTTIRALQQKAREAEAQGVRVRSESYRRTAPGHSFKNNGDIYNVDGNKQGKPVAGKKGG